MLVQNKQIKKHNKIKLKKQIWKICYEMVLEFHWVTFYPMKKCHVVLHACEEKDQEK